MQSIRKRFSLLQVISLAAIAALSLAVGVTEVQADHTLVLNVDVDEASFVSILASGGNESFNIVGAFGNGGTFRCWGWIDGEGVGSVSQVFNIPGRGSIMTQGIEGGLLAITGGTGDFNNLRGDALQIFTGDGFNFTIEFEGKGARF